MTEVETFKEPIIIDRVIKEHGKDITIKDVQNWEELSQTESYIHTGFYNNNPKVSMYRFIGWNKNSKYTGSILREIRKTHR